MQRVCQSIDRLGAKEELENAFFGKGAPGAKLASEAEKIRKAVTLPKFLVETLRSGKTDPQIEALRLNFAEDLPFVLPTFFRLVSSLRKIKREFGLVIWVRRADAKLAANELNAFFSGDHPCYNGKNGTPLFKMDNGKGGRAFKVGPENLFSLTESPQGTLQMAQVESDPDCQVVCQGFEEIWARVRENLKKVA